MSPAPITAATRRPLLNADGSHWHDHGRAVVHVQPNGQPLTSARLDVYSHMREGRSAPLVVLSGASGPFVMSFCVDPAEARRLAALIVTAADTADRVRAAIAQLPGEVRGRGLTGAVMLCRVTHIDGQGHRRRARVSAKNVGDAIDQVEREWGLAARLSCIRIATQPVLRLVQRHGWLPQETGL